MKIIDYSGPFVVTCEIKISYSIYKKEVIGTLMRTAVNNIVMCIVLISVIHEHGVSLLFFPLFFWVFHNLFISVFSFSLQRPFNFWLNIFLNIFVALINDVIFLIVFSTSVLILFYSPATRDLGISNTELILNSKSLLTFTLSETINALGQLWSSRNPSAEWMDSDYLLGHHCVEIHWTFYKSSFFLEAFPDSLKIYRPSNCRRYLKNHRENSSHT